MIFFIFTLAVAVQLFFYLFFFLRLGGKRTPSPHYPIAPRFLHAENPVSVVICAKNEEENLLHNLPSVLEQDFGEYEVVVVDDSSSDGTRAVLEQLRLRYPRLRIVGVEKDDNGFMAGKKRALTKGIRSARYPLLLLTDADCRPASALWIRMMQQHFREGADVVIGYAPYNTSPGFVNQLARYDTFSVGLLYLSFATAGLTYMGVGRNLAYRKKVFEENGGFAAHGHLPSGDDDLFINRLGRRYRVAVETVRQAHAICNARHTAAEWFARKRRHLTTAVHYRWQHRLILGMFHGSQLAFFLCFAFIMMQTSFLLWSPALFILRYLIHFAVLKKAMGTLGEKDLLLLSPFYEGVQLLLNLFILPVNLIIGQHKWKTDTYPTCRKKHDMITSLSG